MEKKYKLTFSVVHDDNHEEVYIASAVMKDVPENADMAQIVVSVTQTWSDAFSKGTWLLAMNQADKIVMLNPKGIKRLTVLNISEIVEGEVHEGNN